MTLIDLFREFNKEATAKSYPQSARSLFHTLLWIWNERKRPSEISLQRQALIALTGQADSTFRDSFSYLSSRGWVKRLNSRNRVTFTYKLRDDRAAPAQAVDFPISARAIEIEAERKEIFSKKNFLSDDNKELREDENATGKEKNRERNLDETLITDW